MTGTPDFERMSRDEIANWLLEADGITPWREWAKPSSPSGTFVQVDRAGEPVERVVTVKMPSDMVARLDSAAGRDRAGRSGIIRAAVEECLERHEGGAHVAVLRSPVGLALS
jgi:hypothetical protein